MTLIVLFGAFLWDGILGEPPVSIHPTVWMGAYIKSLWNRRKRRGALSDFLRGGGILLSGACLFSVPLFFILSIIGSWQPILKILLSLFLLKVSFSLRFLLSAAGEIRRALEKGDLEEARRLTSYHLVSRDTSRLSEGEIVSATVESIAENLTDSVTAPLFYFFLGGVPAAWAYRFVNTADALIAYRTPEFEWGGKPTAWADSLLNRLPARVTAWGIVGAAYLLPGFSGSGARRTMRRCRSRTASPNAGWTMSAMAGALGILLEKKGEYALEGGEEPRGAEKIDNARKIAVLSLVPTLLFLWGAVEGGVWLLNTAV